MENKQDQTVESSSDDDALPPSRQPFLLEPPLIAILPPSWPPRPDIFDEVLLRKPMTPERAHDAYMAWYHPDQDLGQVWRLWDAKSQRPYPRPPENDEDLHILAHNVYEHLMSDPLVPAAWEESEQVLAEQALDSIYDLSQNMQQTKKAAIQSGSLGYLSLLNLQQLQMHCKELGLSCHGEATDLRLRIAADSMSEWSGMLAQSDLSHWGISRPAKFDLEPWKQPKADALEMYTVAIQISPYNPTYWVSRAYCHYLRGFFDLAIGDAYRAGILCDVLEQASERNRRPGFYVRILEAIEAHLMVNPRDENGNLKPEVVRMRRANGINAFVPTLQKALHSIISLSLAGLNAWHDYGDHIKILDQRLGMPDRDVRVPQLRAKLSRKAAKLHQDHIRVGRKPFFHEKGAGEVPASRPYPFEKQDVHRTSPAFLQKLNEAIFGEESSAHEKGSPLCHIDRVDEDHELGVFAIGNIQKDAIIHTEEPTIRGHLPPRRVGEDLPGKAADKDRCENCLKEVEISATKPKEYESANQCACATKWLRYPEGPGLSFCDSDPQSTGKKGCLDIAREVHHFSSCGKDWRWLYDAMRPVVGKWEGKEYFTHTNEAHGTVLMLLLRNVFEIALHRRNEEPEEDMRLNPHEIDELLVLDGASTSWRNSWFPFTMAANIKVPFDILESLGVDIFQRPEFDTWVIQVILRKLLVNAVPWDPRRQGEVSDRLPFDGDKQLLTPKAQLQLVKKKKPLTNLDPSFCNLYLFPGLSLFNHSCDGSHNADWGYDELIPNRVVVWATKPIAPGEEIRIRYRPSAITSDDCATRLFGRPCRCTRCLQKATSYQDSDADTFTDQQSVDEETSANTRQSRDESWRASNDPDSDSDEPSSYFDASDEIDLTESLQSGQDTDHAVVDDGRVVVYRELTSPKPAKPLVRKRQSIESEEYFSDYSRPKMIRDLDDKTWHIPSDSQKHAQWVREYRENLRDRLEGKEVKEKSPQKKAVGKKKAVRKLGRNGKKK
ncbi:hypothetical protein N7539_002995 [Penicillium diatomitis]|uniref:Histone-lysine N-methyltransferase SET5 n=1 Tax=Penicillium diatomitis TaxID=2819901 RepID=A0A9X0BZL9_9EURO|nr:uncharacterized protein N7539_002995 [Penicillium diatomitis]KAJ5491428.1 hypothetical protein N7539_002995 [Penicillium diatomitis]